MGNRWKRQLAKARDHSANGNSFDRLLAEESTRDATPSRPTKKPKRRRPRRKRKPQWDGTYPSYLRSEHWQRMRAVILERAGGRCETCKRAVPLQIHHKRYRLFQEQPDDLIALCDECHGIEHEQKYGPRGGLWSEFVAIAGASRR